MSYSVVPSRPVSSGHRRRRSVRTDRVTLRRVRRAVVIPLLLLAVLAGAALALWVMGVSRGWVLGGLAGGLVAVGVAAGCQSRAAARALHAAATDVQAAELAKVADAAAAVEKSLLWSADELCRGMRPPVPHQQVPRSAGPAADIEAALGELQAQAVTSLIRVHDESRSMVLLEVLRRLAQREHALVGRALEALSRLENLTDDPELLDTIFHIDHLVTRMRRQVESTSVLGGQSLRRMRQAVSVTLVLRGAVSEVVQYPRVSVAAGSVGTELGLPGHVGPDLTHVLAELIENACECSDPATRVTVRAQRVSAGLAIEVEDRALPMHPEMRERMNRLLAQPDEVDVSGQVRAGQLGLLVAAKIAQRHGLVVRLQENATGGTTALVVVPDQLLVPITSTRESSGALRESEQPPAAAASRQTAPTSRAAAGAEPLLSRAQGAPESAPGLPRRERRAGTFRPPVERDQPPVTAATPGLAAAFLSGAEQQARRSGPPAAPAAPPQP
ncbi:ATP-binding protein [Streptomyces sp. ISL-12]|uniref:ATP-binding protein n=1 Tax=Streptomyces sp. ISL-12 TaxID=2819177 RepID=UPI001BE832C7|nr:ATP-binding protein [Streptomyces sp. ISL-12]MBT2412061.1 ATP-binding protein [Streptomyces sp. ISL-12]